MTQPSPVTFAGSRWIFLRLLGVVYFIAFVSLAVQVTGLVGEHGLLPVGEFLAEVHQRYGASAYYNWPTLVWLSPSDAWLSSLCWFGAAASESSRCEAHKADAGAGRLHRGAAKRPV